MSELQDSIVNILSAYDKSMFENALFKSLVYEILQSFPEKKRTEIIEKALLRLGKENEGNPENDSR
jgi:hypothetical protein